MNTKVKVWEEDIFLPTYRIGKPEKNPMFLEKRVYQGSSGVVYPYPVVEKIEDECQDQKYRAVYLENEYIKVMILPELGGRIQMAYDKIKQRHFIYYNQVIKPALVGLTGPWISGGIEFNWPQHHRPSTFLPIDFTIEECADGSAVVWVSERERMFHQKGMAGFTLRPGRAVIEIQGKVYNPTPVPQTFLWWANPAVAVNDEYQSVFPMDVNAVFDHGKRDVSSYPIATGIYYKMDYSSGVDISRYKNIPVPTSYMAIKSSYDFVGGYENDTQAGVLHVANHHISPGKKQWTWGNGDFGQAWDRNLTDTDGPYIELMTGVYTDNQPDFTWLQPYEEKSFTQYFLPYRELGVVKNACSDLLFNIEEEEGCATLKLFATSAQQQLRILVQQGGDIMLDIKSDLHPETVFEQQLPGVSLASVSVRIYRSNGTLLLSWKLQSEEIKPMPEAAKPALTPTEVGSAEQLYLTGLHLEQYRHATYHATDYYQEALRRDEGDIRNNNAMGLWLIRKGQFAQAEPYLRRAIDTLTERNPNPYESEPLYNLGLSLKYQSNKEEAYGYFYKACWNAAWQDAGYYALAQISCSRGEWETALSEIDLSLIRNWHNHRARHLKVICLRQLGRHADAAALIQESVKIDPFNFGCRFEEFLLSESDLFPEHTRKLMREDARNYEELALDYAQAGCWAEALRVVDVAMQCVPQASPMLFYYQSWFLQQMGCMTDAIEAAKRGEEQPQADYFPNALEAILALQSVISLPISVPKAYYLLGNIWYDKRQYPEAIDAWEHSKKLNSCFPTVLRNLSLAYFNKQGKMNEAVILLERAFKLDTTDGRILMELDQLYKRMNGAHTQRLQLLDAHKQTAFERDDLYLEYVTLLNQLGHYDKAMAMIDARQFHPWEGGEGKVPAQYQLARIERSKEHLAAKEYQQALKLIDECFVYPPHFGEGKLHGAQENDFLYYKGCVLEEMGCTEEANRCFLEASVGSSQPAAAIYYNDQKPDKIFYQGLALRRLGREGEASERFNCLIEFGKKHLADCFKMDYFAVSLPDLQIWEDDMDKKNTIHCNYLMALGYLGLGHKEEATACFATAAQLDNNHQGIQVHQKMIH